MTELTAALDDIGVPRVIAQSAAAVPHTGTTSETTLATITLPAGSMGANGRIEIDALWSVTNSANTKNTRVRLGGTEIYRSTLTTSAALRHLTMAHNRNSQASQVAMDKFTANGTGASGNAVTTAAVDTSAEQTITLTAQLASAAETITLESYIVTVFPRA